MPYLKINGVKTYYEEQGKGFPLLVLMGLGMVIPSLKPWVDEFSKKYRVIVADPRGCGRSELVPGPYTVKQLAEDSALLLDSIGVKNAHAVGVSMGGHVAQELALLRPDMARGLILAMTAARSNARARERLKLWADLKKEGRTDLFVRDLYLWIFDNDHFENEKQNKEWMENEIKAKPAVPAGNYVSMIEAAAGFDALDRIPSIKSKTLCFRGERDLIFIRAEAEEMAAAIPGAALETLDCAHAIMGSAADVFLKKTMDFLALADK